MFFSTAILNFQGACHFIDQERFSMSNRFRTLFMLTTLFTGAVYGIAGDYSPRQYYGNWQRHPTAGYHYRSYYYKPTPTYQGYKHHYVISPPTSRQHHYYYNPYTKKYWGRCPSQHDGDGGYSKLAPEDQKASLKEIPESAFPKPSDLPEIPESSDGAILDLPPDDLPEGGAPAG